MNNEEHPLVRERKNKNLTQKELAVRLQLSSRTIWCAENNISISLDSRRRICVYFRKTVEELGLNLSSTNTQGKGVEAQNIDDLGGSIVTSFDKTKRETLRKIAALTTGACLVDTDGHPEKAKEENDKLDLDMIDDYVGVLHKLFEKGESSYVLHHAQKWYTKLGQKQRISQDIRLAETYTRIGMLMCTAQQYVLPWYQRDEAVLQTYNHLEEMVFQKVPLNTSLLSTYAQLLAKRGRHHRVLWQFDLCIKESETGLAYAKEVGDFSLYTHFLCELAHIAATKGDEFQWLQKLEEARQSVLENTNQTKALNQIDYMQGEGYKRIAFHMQKNLSLATREKYANVAISRFDQWDGTTIELPDYESLVVTTSKAQCLVLLNPEEALNLTGQLRKPAERNYPTLLDKIYRIEFLAHQRMNTSKSAFSQVLQTQAYRSGKNVI